MDSYRGVVLETSFQEGIRREALRSLAQLVNSSEVAVQVCNIWKPTHKKHVAACIKRRCSTILTSRIEVQVAIVEAREADDASPAPAATKVLTAAGRALHWHRIQHHDVCTTAGLEVAAVAACDLQRPHPMLLNPCTPLACSRSAPSRWQCLRTSDSCRCEAGALAICYRQTASATVVLAHAMPLSFRRSLLSQVSSESRIGMVASPDASSDQICCMLII